MEKLDLSSFYGSECWYKGWLGVLYTDGVKFISLKGLSWFVTDAISVIKTTKLNLEPFLSIKLKIKDKTADMTITDGNDKVLYEQHYSYTDCQQDIDLYMCDNVIMLSSEY